MRLWHELATYLSGLQHVLSNVQQSVAPPITIGEEWHVLGPFSVGTREAIWGADPLEALGGFHVLQYDRSQRFRSPLTVNGTTSWSLRTASINYPNSVTTDAELEISFPDVDWNFLQQVYGWAALQWQGWARGSIHVNTDTVVTLNLQLEHVLELWIDDKHYFGGDFYSFHRAALVLRLEPGEHTVELRVIRDVRSMGGITDDPSVDLRLTLATSKKALTQAGQILYSDRLDDWKGPLAGTYASVVLRNDNDTDVYIHSLDAKHNACVAQLLATSPIRLTPGQSRPVAFQIDCIPGTSAYLSIDLHFGYSTGEAEHSLFVGLLARPPVARTEPHIITFLHPSGIVSFAVLRPPKLDSCPSKETLPLLVALHGAGVDVAVDEAKHALDGAAEICAWILLPSGVTSWSGDDWHTWGWADVEAAIRAIPAWIDQVAWRGPGVDISRYLVTGHSNGGQGVWYALTHHPDDVIAAAPLSGYSSIQNYVPYKFWQPADPGRTAVIQAQLMSYQHELLLENAIGIPVLQQHGGADDNVPTYHSRLMYDQIHRYGAASTYIEYQGLGHVWDGMMTTSPLLSFYKEHLVPRIPEAGRVADKFSIVTANPAATGSKHGLRILLLIIPGQLGSIRASHGRGESGSCQIRSKNVESLQLAHDFLQDCSSLSIDGQTIKFDVNTDGITIQHLIDGEWSVNQSKLSPCTRSGRQQGGLEAILRTHGSFQIVQHSPGTQLIATQIANNLLQYFGADAELALSYADALSSSGNVISIAIGDKLPARVAECATTCRFELTSRGQLRIRTNHEALHSFDIKENGIVAAAFLQTLPDERLELVFWAIDIPSIGISTRLLPIMTGSGQPDFVVATRHMLERGIEGVFATGYLNSSWCPSPNSFFAA